MSALKRMWIVLGVILFMLGSLALFLFRGNTEPGWDLPDWEMRNVELGRENEEVDSE